MQQQLTPAQALRTLSSAYARHRGVHPLPSWLSSVVAVLVTALMAATILVYLSVPGMRLLGVLFACLTLGAIVGSPAIIARNSLRQQEHEQAHNALLLIVKDQSDRLEAPDLLFALRHLAPTAPPPLPALLRARLTEKLPYTDTATLRSLPDEDHAWLREALLDPESDETLIVAILLALDLTPDTKAQAAMTQLAQTGKTERIREAAKDALQVGGR